MHAYPSTFFNQAKPMAKRGGQRSNNNRLCFQSLYFLRDAIDYLIHNSPLLLCNDEFVGSYECYARRGKGLGKQCSLHIKLPIRRLIQETPFVCTYYYIKLSICSWRIKKPAFSPLCISTYFRYYFTFFVNFLLPLYVHNRSRQWSKEKGNC